MNLQEFLSHAGDMTGCMLVSAADCFRVSVWPVPTESFLAAKDRILEIRIFNEEEERKLFRPDIQSDFTARTIRERENRYPFFDEYQYLDIDTKKGQSADTMEVTATGGGRYALPFTDIEDARIQIRYYLDHYPETGQARIKDWRIVRFVGGHEDGI